MSQENLEKLGQLIDRLDNLMMASKLPLPATLHLEGILPALPEIRAEIMEVYTDEGGENVWE